MTRLNRLTSPVVSATASRILFAAGLALTVTLGASTLVRAQAHVKSARLARSAESLPAPIKSYGSSGAPIRIDVFTDYECPMCRNLYEQTLRPMIGDYVAAGKVYLVHHDYPLNLAEHKFSGQAARWVNVAAEFGQFQAAEAALYDNQAAWSESGDIAKYIAGAMPSSDFHRVEKVMAGCEAPGPKGEPGGIIAAPHPCSIDSYIDKDITLGNQIPLQATPTYVITYKRQRLPPGTGFVSWQVLKPFLDSLLRQ